VVANQEPLLSKLPSLNQAMLKSQFLLEQMALTLLSFVDLQDQTLLPLRPQLLLLEPQVSRGLSSLTHQYHLVVLRQPEDLVILSPLRLRLVVNMSQSSDLIVVIPSLYLLLLPRVDKTVNQVLSLLRRLPRTLLALEGGLSLFLLVVGALM
jgi:hypothetical protein